MDDEPFVYANAKMDDIKQKRYEREGRKRDSMPKKAHLLPFFARGMPNNMQGDKQIEREKGGEVIRQERRDAHIGRVDVLDEKPEDVE